MDACPCGRPPGIHATALYPVARTVRSMGPQGAPRHQVVRAPRVHHGRCRTTAAFLLRFVRGVVDTSDLPLNVSREILQESKDIEAIRSGCTKKILGLLEDLAANDKEKYAKFWAEFGLVLKE